MHSKRILGLIAVTWLTSSTAQAQADRLGALGIGVSDLAASARFYTEVLGLKSLRTYQLGYLDEIVMGYADGDTAVVLMHWPNDKQRRYDGNNVKLVFYVADPVGVIERIRERGGVIDREATPIEVLGGTVVGLGRDPDNYVIEVIKR
jgi:catechol 2,3-dioxygenase-like lactoylglutathione lyase family enzyme